jgi:3-deoxy-manno-octulosonate cytidylyltransferase (CMP-KDO synthetase)
VRAAIVIPARYQSTRLPGKMLLSQTGKYLVQHVYERAGMSRLAQKVLIATDDERILSAAASFGAEAVLTSGHHRTGTERVAEAASSLDVDFVVNLQGDEPTIDPELIDGLFEVLDTQKVDVATAAFRFSDPERARDPNLVKVVVDRSGNALYFSRSALPYYRNGDSERIYYGHVGIYAYRRDFLLALTKLDETELEAAEKLEQLRILENGYSIRVVISGRKYAGIDTKEDYEGFVRQWRKKSQKD